MAINRRGGRRHCNPPPITGLDAEKSDGAFFDTRLQIEYSSRVSAKAALIGLGGPSYWAVSRLKSLMRLFYWLIARGY